MEKCTAVFMLLLIQYSASNTLNPGDICLLKPENVQGTCLRLEDCPSARNKFMDLVREPQRCGYDKQEILVCCDLSVPQPVAEQEAFSNLHVIPSQPPYAKHEEHLNPSGINSFSTSTTSVRPSIPTKKPGTLSKSKCLEYSNQLQTNRKKNVCTLQRSTLQVNKHLVDIAYEANGSIYYGCEGAIVSENFILTSAKCLLFNKKYFPLYVRLRAANKTASIKTLHIHSGYDVTTMLNRYNDIALFELKQKLVFSTTIQPACLNIRNLRANPNFVVNWNSQEDANLSDANLIGQKLCNETLGTNNIRYPEGITNKLVCANLSSCELGNFKILESIDMNNCMFTLNGMFAFNGGCQYGFPYVFTKINKYLSWIESVLWNVTN